MAVLGIQTLKSLPTQGAKEVIFTACHLGKLKLAFTSPDIIWTSPKSFLMSRIDFTVLPLFEYCSKNITCLLGKLKTEFTSAIAKSSSPSLSDTTFFARCYIWQNKPVGIIVMKIEKQNSFFNQCFRCHYSLILRPILFALQNNLLVPEYWTGLFRVLVQSQAELWPEIQFQINLFFFASYFDHQSGTLKIILP